MANFNQSRNSFSKKYIAKKLVYETVDFLREKMIMLKNIYGVKPLEDKKALDMSNEQNINLSKI